MVLRVQDDDLEVFLLQGHHVHHQEVGSVGGRLDLRLLLRHGDLQPAADLEGGLEAGGAGGADALNGDELLPRQLRQAEEAFVGGEQGGGVFEVVGAEDDRQQLDGAECAGAVVLRDG